MAIQAGVREIGFAEHWDVGPYERHPRFFNPKPWYDELEHLRKQFSGQLIIRAGVEIAEPHLYAQETREVLELAAFDYVIGSVHFVGEDFMFDDTIYSFVIKVSVVLVI